MLIDPLITKAISIGLGLIFIISSYHKLAEAAQLRVTLIEYQVMPETLVAPASRVIPIVELLLGGAWLIGYYSQGMTAISSALLLGFYALAIGIIIASGRVHFDCGC